MAFFKRAKMSGYVSMVTEAEHVLVCSTWLANPVERENVQTHQKTCGRIIKSFLKHSFEIHRYTGTLQGNFLNKNQIVKTHKHELGKLSASWIFNNVQKDSLLLFENVKMRKKM